MPVDPTAPAEVTVLVVDDELQRRLDARKFPRIRGELFGSAAGTSRLTVRQVDPRTL